MASPRLPGPRSMRLFKSSFDQNPDMRSPWRDVEMDTGELIREVLAEVRRNMIQFLRGYTNVARPGDYRAQFGPLFAGRPAPDRNKVEWSAFANWWNKPRAAHPGGWADITTDLMAKYKSEVIQNGPADFVLTLDNTSEHAPYVEAMAGFFVVEGVFEPGGYVQRSIEKAFNYMSRRVVRGPRGGRRGLSAPTVMTTSDGTSISARGIEP